MTEINNKKYPISVFIITKNEEDRIYNAIKSVIDWVEEVIIVDSGSTDKTQEISKELGATVIYQEWLGYGPQKRFAEDQCQQNWILNIDADEVVSNDLREEIQKLFNQGIPSQIYGYRISICTVLPPYVSQRHWDYPQMKPVRLYDIRQGRYKSHRTHDRVEMDEKHVDSNHLKGIIEHHTVRDLSSLLQKLNGYSDEQVMVMSPPVGTLKTLILKIRILFEFFGSFIKFYFLKRLFLYGLYGFILAMIYSSGRFLRMAKLYEKKLKENT